MLISDITKRILIYDNYEHAKHTEQDYLENNEAMGVQLEQIDLHRWKVEVIYRVGDCYKRHK